MADFVEKDTGWAKLQQLVAKVQSDNPTIAVGIQGDLAEVMDKDHGELTNIELAVIHEFGAPSNNIPKRPFIEPTVVENQDYLQKELEKIVNKLFDGETPEGSLILLGEELRVKMLEKIKAGIPPALSELTLAQRKPGQGTTPLWATGQLANAIAAALVDRNEIK